MLAGCNMPGWAELLILSASSLSFTVGTHRAMRPTGNWSPALVERLTDFLPAVLPLPRPAPDMVAQLRVRGVQEGAGGV